MLGVIMRAQSQQARTDSTKALRFAFQTWAVNVVVCIPAIMPMANRASDHVEITVELNSTWRSQWLTNQHSVRATCIVSSNDWFISGSFLKNAKVDYWLVGTNVVEHRTITISMYVEQAKEFVSEKFLGQNPRSPYPHSYPRAGETFTTIHPSPLGQPAFHGMEGVTWLAYCSGSYLKQTGRKIPMPIGPSSLAFGYADNNPVSGPLWFAKKRRTIRDEWNAGLSL
jgi:hypothetical protein